MLTQMPLVQNWNMQNVHVHVDPNALSVPVVVNAAGDPSAQNIQYPAADVAQNVFIGDVA